jgi:hypothetical protein
MKISSSEGSTGSSSSALDMAAAFLLVAMINVNMGWGVAGQGKIECRGIGIEKASGRGDIKSGTCG